MLYQPNSADNVQGRARSLPIRFFVLLVILALLILFLGRTDSATMSALRDRTAEAFSSIFGFLSAPVGAAVQWVDGIGDVVLVYQDNTRLREENAAMYEWRARAIRAEAKLARFNALLDVSLDPDLEFVTARAVSDGSSPFVRTMIINAGYSEGVSKGQAVVNEFGLVGWVVGVSGKAARVLLATDLNSRIPVKIGVAAQRAILTGDNGPQPRLEFLMATGAVRPGDTVMTSGDDGVLPPGLVVGNVAGRDHLGIYRVSWNAGDRPIDYVRVLRFKFPRSLDEEPAPVLPPEMTGGEPGGAVDVSAEAGGVVSGVSGNPANVPAPGAASPPQASGQ